jgi:hypothetical protein
MMVSGVLMLTEFFPATPGSPGRCTLPFFSLSVG